MVNPRNGGMHDESVTNISGSSSKSNQTRALDILRTGWVGVIIF